MKILSKLENNIIEGVLIKKGKNTLKENDFIKLSKNPEFMRFVQDKKFILEEQKKQEVKETKKEAKKEPEKKDDKSDFDSMSYDELKKYVKENNIKVDSYKKADLLNTLKNI